jgi:hypothetical protein
MSIIDNAKEIAELIKKYNDQELYQKLVSLREEILELREENIKLKELVSQHEAASKIAAELYRDGNAYYIDKEGQERSGPYCMTCWDYESKLVNMSVKTNNIQGRKLTTVTCGICAARRKQN